MRIKDSVVALWVYLDVVMTFIAVPYIYIHLYLETTLIQNLNREMTLLIHREQMYEQEYGQKTELSMADMLKRRIMTESKDPKQLWKQVAE